MAHALRRDGGTDRITMIIGPPGTGMNRALQSNNPFLPKLPGKTTVIAATVISLINGTTEDFVWIIAQSNIAVKNIAEKLLDCEFTDFRLLVSKEFITEWSVTLFYSKSSNHSPNGL